MSKQLLVQAFIGEILAYTLIFLAGINRVTETTNMGQFNSTNLKPVS
jgi:hypothetical protein